MKQITLSLVLLVGALFLVTACKKADPKPAPSGPPVFPYVFEATVGGQHHATNGIYLNYFPDQGYFTFYCTPEPQYHFFDLYVSDTLRAGKTYPLTGVFATGGTASLSFADAPFHTYQCNGGYLKVIEHDTVLRTMKATFAGSLYHEDTTLVLTGGKFNIEY